MLTLFAERAAGLSEVEEIQCPAGQAQLQAAAAPRLLLDYACEIFLFSFFFLLSSFDGDSLGGLTGT